MSGRLLDAWDHLALDVWEPLGDYSTPEASAPPDLFGDLFAATYDFVSPRPTTSEMAELRGNPIAGRERFLSLRAADFTSESAAVQFIEEVHDVISDYEVPAFVDFYRQLIRASLRKFNLRYRLDEPFTLRFLLPGSFGNLYSELQRVNGANPHVSGLLLDFEKAFDRYARSEDSSDLRTCIAKASNYAEGLASATAGNPTTSNTLGSLAGRLTDWPHDKLREALVNVYHFCCDYPGIRHGGVPGSANRDLAVRDATLASLLLLSFSGYLSTGLDERAILGL
jgi:hypothetical protein